MYVTDRSGAVVLMAEDSQPYVRAGKADPYRKLFKGQFPYEVLQRVPWKRLQVIPPPS